MQFDTPSGGGKDVNQLHERIVKEINDERNQEISGILEEKHKNKERADKDAKRLREEAKARGHDVDEMDSFYKKLGEERQKELEEIKKKHGAEKQGEKAIPAEEFRSAGLDAALMPADARSLPPSYAAVFSTKDERDKLSGGTGTDVYNYSILDPWCWASGGGWGWAGSGAGSYSVWSEWGYWFLPNISKYYGITTHNTFRGYYIVRSFDDWWISAYSRALVTVYTNVYQYNWKGWSANTVLDVGGDNINVNQRFDTDRHLYYSALLAGGDWAYVRNAVQIYVYARADGSYSELNFAAGTANYLAAPHVHIV